MDEIEQAREGLLIYLQANRSYIQEKVYNQFNVECIENKPLKSLSIQKMRKTIKDIFDFSNNKIYQYFFSNLENNIKNFIKQQYSTKAIQSFYVLDIQKLTDIVKYCITHGFDEKERLRLKEEKEKKGLEKSREEKQKAKDKDREKVKQVIRERPKITSIYVAQQKKPEPYKDQFPHIKPKISTFLEPDKIPQKKQFKIERYSMPETNVLPRYLANIAKSSVIKQQQETPAIIVAPLDTTYINAHKKLLRERLQKLFNFYCFQQSNLGQGPTFDHIKSQGEAMNLGKFMQFCQYTKLFNCKDITKDSLIAQFKRTSQGKIEIHFQTFEKIVRNLDQKYLSFMGNDNVNNPIPTFQARLLLNQPSKLGQLKKHRNLIFGTRSKQGRQIKQQTDRIYNRKELTGHSGRFVNDLSLDLKDKLQIKASKSVQKPKLVKQLKTTVDLNDLKNLKLPKIHWIVDEEDESRQ